MKKLMVLSTFLLFLVSCANLSTTQSQSQPINLQSTIEQLESLSNSTIEAKRTAAKIILDNWLFDGGFWTVIFQNSTSRPNNELQIAVVKLTELAKTKSTLDDFGYGRAVGYYVVVVRELIHFNVLETIPQITKILDLL